MKFVCHSCGKRFASVDEPFPGRVYKIRCGRCGTLLTVQAPVPWEAPSVEIPLVVAPPVEGARLPEPAPAPRAAPPPLPREAPPVPAPVPAPAQPVPPDYGTEEIPVDLGLSDELPLLQRKHRSRERRMTLAISAAAAAGLLLIVGMMMRAASGTGAGSGSVAGTGTGTATATATATGTATAAAPAPAPVPVPAPVTAPAPAQYPAYPMPTGPVTKPAPAPVAAALPPAPRPAPRPERPAAKPAPRLPAPPSSHTPAPTSARVAFEGQRGRPAAPAAPAAVDPGLAASTLLRKQDAPVRTGLPDPTELSRVLDGRRAALDACFDYAATSAGGAAWQGRSAQLLVKVAGTGAATARVDDPALEPTEIASCLRRTVARTAFPAFAGEPVELRAQVGIPRE